MKKEKRQLVLDFESSHSPETKEEGVITLKNLFDAYYSCRKNKRNTANALKFEMNYEENLMRLLTEINNGSYQIARSIAFIVEKPVKREIFAADFRDRIVHHLLINKLNYLFEKEFVFDSYSCRKGKGTLAGVKRVSRFIRACSENYTHDCYVLKLDIQGFFMSIRRDLLWDKLHELIGSNYCQSDKEKLLRLTKLVVMNDCTRDCTLRSDLKKWEGLPASKSLFHRQDTLRGLPIGNLTSQVFANFYMSTFDHFVKSQLKVRYYVRYVDDFLIVHQDKDYLKRLIVTIRDFLLKELGLTLHPHKITLQHFGKGVKFTGAYILPNRIYVERRTKTNFYQTIEKWNNQIREPKGKLTRQELTHFQSSVNSYLGFMRHYSTYKLRKKMLYGMSAKFDRYVRPANGYTKLVNMHCAYMSI